ncbi:UvrD-helicase domain-containing protein [Thermophilibacter sp.]
MTSPTVDLSGLNGRQRKIATTLDEPLFVEAGAGSGKTSTLTKRVAWALSPGSGADGRPFLDDLSQVLVITFTEAAAREIRERVRATLRASGMAEAALGVDDAWISTIHGMCRRILARHALDLGLDPGFQVVADSRQAALFDRAMNDVMRAALDVGELAGLLDAYSLGSWTARTGYTGVMGLVSRLVSAGRALPGGLGALAAAPHDADAAWQAVRDLTMRFEELGACRLTPAGAAAVAASLEALRPLERLKESGRTPEALLAALGQVRAPSSSKAIAAELAAAKAALALARAEVAFAGVAPLADTLLDLARRVDARYEEVKLDEGVLDNDDLVRKALLAVRDHEEVRRDYAGRFRLVMVDEFQDTDETQLELISLLAGEDAAHLCTVGDAQQSIYRFRGADVGVFRGRGERVAERGVVRLDVNYRSHADVLALVERVCTGGDGPARGVMADFMHLDANPGRADAYRARELPRIDVEVCAGKGSAGRASRHQVATLAAQVADALARYRDAGERPGDMALLLGVTTHADLYIDAIRARGMRCVVTGGSTFTSTDEVRVVRALLHTLANAQDTQSGLFPLLASEMFGLDANDFCELGTREQDKLDALTKRPIWRGLLDLDLVSGHVPSRRLARAHEVLTRALSDVRHRGVADVCADVVRDSGWLARLEASGPEGLARAANVLAAVRYVRDLTEELGLGPARAATEFDRWLDAAKVPPASLAGGEADSGDGTVRVMTVHASKGLEFGVCAVAECWGNPTSDAQLAIGPAPGGGREFVVRPADLAARDLAGIDPEELEASADRARALPLAARYLAMRASDAEAEERERARLLYVALTRAREALVVGVAGASGKEGVCSRLAAATLEALTGGAWEATAGERPVDYGGSAPARLRCVVVERSGRGADAVVTADSAGTLAGFDAELPADAALVARLGTAAAGAPEASGPEPFDLYEPDAAARLGVPWMRRPRAGVFSYSSVRAQLDAAEAPERRAPSAREARAAEEGAPAAEDADRATNLGSAFHELAQALVESPRGVDDARVAAQVRRWHLSPRAEARLRAALARWEGSAVRAEALAWPRVRAEVPFFRRVERSPYGDHLEGAIDLLCCDEPLTRALVVDYKTGDAGLAPEEVRARHEMQARFYAEVLLAEGAAHVTCAFVCVEREDPDAPGEPLVARYEFGS